MRCRDGINPWRFQRRSNGKASADPTLCPQSPSQTCTVQSASVNRGAALRNASTVLPVDRTRKQDVCGRSRRLQLRAVDGRAWIRGGADRARPARLPSPLHTGLAEAATPCVTGSRCRGGDFTAVVHSHPTAPVSRSGPPVQAVGGWRWERSRDTPSRPVSTTLWVPSTTLTTVVHRFPTRHAPRPVPADAARLPRPTA